MQAHGIPQRAEDSLKILERQPSDVDEGVDAEDMYEDADAIALWKITTLSMWQQVDRRIDE